MLESPEERRQRAEQKFARLQEGNVVTIDGLCCSVVVKKGHEMGDSSEVIVLDLKNTQRIIDGEKPLRSWIDFSKLSRFDIIA